MFKQITKVAVVAIFAMTIVGSAYSAEEANYLDNNKQLTGICVLADDP